MAQVQPIYPQPPAIIQNAITTQPVSNWYPPKNRWVNSLCGCCSDPGSSLNATCCFPCFLGSLAGRFGETCIYGCCCSCHFLTVARPVLRARHNIEGNLCNDALASCCCPCCVLCQVDREMNVYNYSR